MWAIFYYPSLITGALVAVDIILYALSYATSSELFSFAARVLSSYLCLILCAIYGALASIALRLIGEHRLAQWSTARVFKWTMQYTTGVSFIIVEGEEYLSANRPSVIIGNHQTELDVLLLGTIFPRYCSVTAKKSLKYMPFLGWFMTLSGTVFLDRARRDQAVKAFEGAAKEMKEHRQSVFIFPEGTRSYAKDPVMLPFKKGAFHLAVQAGVPIVPVVAENYSRVLHIKDKRFHTGNIRVKGMSVQQCPWDDDFCLTLRTDLANTTQFSHPFTPRI